MIPRLYAIALSFSLAITGAMRRHVLASGQVIGLGQMPRDAHQ